MSKKFQKFWSVSKVLEGWKIQEVFQPGFKQTFGTVGNLLELLELLAKGVLKVPTNSESLGRVPMF